jgi:hypothetical protein
MLLAFRIRKGEGFCLPLVQDSLKKAGLLPHIQQPGK